MKLTIESTDQLTDCDGVPVRVWKGITPAGVSCLVFVHRIAVAKVADCSQFDRELREQLPPGRRRPLADILTQALPAQEPPQNRSET